MEKVTANSSLPRRHSDPRGLVDSLHRKRNRAHRLIIAASKKFNCPSLLSLNGKIFMCWVRSRLRWKSCCSSGHPSSDGQRSWTGERSGCKHAADMDGTVLSQAEHGQNRSKKRAFQDQGFRHGHAEKGIRLDMDLGDSSTKTNVLGQTLETIKQAAIRVGRRASANITVQEVFRQRLTTTCIEIEDTLRGVAGPNTV